MRINQYIAAGTGLSRRAADTTIAAGRVQVDGRTAELGHIVVDSQQVTLDDVLVVLPDVHSYIMLHKPTGYVSSRVQQTSDPTLYELLPVKYHRLRTAGRLDRDSSGLILLSDDGDFIQALAHPTSGKVKVYEVTLERPVTPAAARQIEAGVQLSDGLSRLEIRILDGRQLTIAIEEGRNRQIRRTFGKLGYTVERLHRVGMGDYQLGGLKAGKWAEIAPKGKAK